MGTQETTRGLEGRCTKGKSNACDLQSLDSVRNAATDVVTAVTVCTNRFSNCPNCVCTPSQPLLCNTRTAVYCAPTPKMVQESTHNVTGIKLWGGGGHYTGEPPDTNAVEETCTDCWTDAASRFWGGGGAMACAPPASPALGTRTTVCSFQAVRCKVVQSLAQANVCSSNAKLGR